MMRILILSLLVASPAVAAPKAPAAPHPGAEVYQNVCQACHMANAMGAVGAGRITALAKNPNLQYPEYPISVVTGGKGAMPWFRGQLTDQQIADVIEYVRGNFGNRYKGKVTAAMVAESGVPAPSGGGRGG
jgi:mono/diheme cytochrome c family protein